MTAALAAAHARLDELAGAWRVSVERVTESHGAVLGFGTSGERPVVLKVSAGACEPQAAAVLEAFGGHGAATLLAQASGALLLERVTPGHSLADLVASDGDDEATRVMAQVIGRLEPGPAPSGVPSIEQWGLGFERYRASGDGQIPAALAIAAQKVYGQLVATQRRCRLLHGDLHHGNVLFDRERGWLAIDPKGVVGELEFETGAALRNPLDRPALFTDAGTIHRRARGFAVWLGLDESRILAWAFAQAVLAAIWIVEDDGAIDPRHGWLTLAQRLRP
jgi:streptomycin 6-kinase